MIECLCELAINMTITLDVVYRVSGRYMDVVGGRHIHAKKNHGVLSIRNKGKFLENVWFA